MEEVWKDVVGYEGIYEVSNMGNVRNRNGKIMKAAPNPCGYMKVDLSNKGKRKSQRIHRMVAQAFLEKPRPCEMDVNHINKIKTDNRVENLEWVTRRENICHSQGMDMVGVSRVNYGGEDRFRASVSIRRKKINLGTHDTPEAAHNAYVEYLNKNGWENKYARNE